VPFAGPHTHGRMLLEDSPDPLISLDTNGVIDDANSAIQIMTGLPLSALAGTDFSSYCTLPDEARYACRQTLREGFVRDWPLEVRHTNGRLTSVFYNASVRHDDDDRVTGVVATVRPVLASPARDLIAPDADAVRFVAGVVEFTALFVITVGTIGLVAALPGSLALVACGSALWLFRTREGRPPGRAPQLIGQLLALLVAIGGVAGVVASADLVHRGQSMPIVAINFLLAGLALLWLDWTAAVGKRLFQPAELLAFVINAGASVVLLDFVFNEHATATLTNGVAQFALSFGLVCARTASGVGALVVSRSYGGTLTRRLWPATIGVPLLIGIASWKAHTAGVLSQQATVTLDIVAMITLLAGLTVWSGMGIDRRDLERRAALAALHRREEELHEAQRLARVGSWWWDPATDTMVWSEELYRIAGCDPKLAAPAFDDPRRCFYTPTSLLQLRGAIDLARREGTPFALDLELVRSDGDLRLVTSRGEAERDSAGRVTRVRGSIQDVTDQRREEKELVRLNRALRALSLCNQALIRTTDESAWLHEVCQIVVQEAGYSFCWVGRAEHDEAKHVTAVAEAGVDGGYLQSVNITWSSAEARLGPTGTCIRTMERQIVMDTASDPSFAPWREEAQKRGYESIIAIPVLVDGERYGALTIYATEAEVFSEEEVALLSELAADLGYGITTLRIRVEQQRGAEEIRQMNTELERRVRARTADLEAAREREAQVGFKIQQMLLLPQPPTDMPGVQLAALTIPSQRVDGDFYDFFKQGDRCLDVIVADVMGKGVPAALLAAATKSNFLEALCHLIAASRREPMPEPKEIVTLAHADMVRQLIDLESFVTLSYARFDLVKGRLDLVDCGHTGMIVLRAAADACEIVHGDNLPLGIREGEIFDQTQIPFAPGDVFVFFSDGVTELRSPDGEHYGVDRLARSVLGHRELAASALVEAIREEALAFAQSDRLNDDLTCVVVRIVDAERPVAQAALDIQSDLSHLGRVRAFVREICGMASTPILSVDEIASLELAVNEAASNVMKHAYRGRSDQRIHLDADAYRDRVAVRLHHLGDPFQPYMAPTPSPDVLRESGFGLDLMSSSVDEVRYSRDDRGKHCIALVKVHAA
jgi:phosphoserine phosphatase RsbU/P